MSGEAILALDTATTAIVVAVGTRRGELLALATWPAGWRHGETLLPAISRLLGDRGIARRDLVGVVVGTGPGAFTGLRVGIATAKGLAHGLEIPIAGVPTAEALIASAARDAGAPAERVVLLLPAGPSDRVAVRGGEAPRLLPGETEPELGAGDLLVAVDLANRAPADAAARGERARERLGAELLWLGAARLGAGTGDDLARLAPEYVSLPRGIRELAGEIRWSRR